MHTLRLSLVGTAILILLGGTFVTVVAQEPTVATGPESAWVTFASEECGPGVSEGTDGRGDGFRWFRGYWGTCEMTFSDPRVNGIMIGDYNDDCVGTRCVIWGNEQITGPDGTWSGWYHGMAGANDAEWTSYHVMTGSGGYEGLTFIWDLTRLWSSGGKSGFGLIYEGDAPPMTEFVMPTSAE
jgi:hypothetical protein